MCYLVTLHWGCVLMAGVKGTAKRINWDKFWLFPVFTDEDILCWIQAPLPQIRSWETRPIASTQGRYKVKADWYFLPALHTVTWGLREPEVVPWSLLLVGRVILFNPVLKQPLLSASENVLPQSSTTVFDAITLFSFTTQGVLNLRQFSFPISGWNSTVTCLRPNHVSLALYRNKHCL